MADGSIRISTKLDTNETKVDLKQVEKECEKTAKRIEDVGKKIKTAFTGETGMDKLADDCGKTAAKLEQVGQTAQAVYTDMSKTQLNSAFKTANKELEKTQAELTEIQNKIAAIQAETDTMLPQATSDEQTAALLDMEGRETQELLAQRDQLTMKAEEYKAQLQAITAELEKQTAEQREQAAISAGGKDLSVAKKDQDFLSGIKGQEEYNATLSSISARMAMIEQQADRIAAKHGVSRDKLLQQDAEYQQLARRQELLINNQDRYQREVEQSTRATKKLGDAGATAGNKASKGLDKASKSSKRMNSNLKNGIKTLGKMALACVAVEGAFTAVRRATTAYLEDNQKLQNQLTSIWSVLGQAIGPVMEWFIQGISTIIVWVNSLVKSLSGIDLIARANAAALKKQEKATKDAAKAAQTAGFDEMTKLSDNTASSSGSGTGPALFDPSMAGDIPDFFEKIKEKIVNGDWAGLGTLVGNKINELFEKIDFEKIGKKVGDIITATLDFGLNLALTLDPSTIINGLINFVSGLFGQLSTWLGEQDWRSIGKTLIGKVFDSIFNVDWGKLATSFAGLAGSIIGALGAAIVGAVEGIWEWIGQTWDSIVAYFDQYVDWGDTPGNIIEGLWNGITAAFANAWDWIVKNIWEPFRDGFCKAFGIASPSKEMKTLGGYVIDGFKEGVKNIWEKVKTFFTDCLKSIKGVFQNIGSWFKSIFTSAWNGIKTAWAGVKTFFSGIWNGVKNVFATVKTWFKNIFSGAWNAIKGVFSGVGSFFSGIWETIKSKFSAIGTSIGNAIGGAFKTVVNAIINFAETTINGFIKAINKAIGLINNIPGVNIKTISLLKIPRLAKGGIVNNPGRGVPVIAGEAGKEAVLPLENNTEWMDILAEKLNAGAQKIVIPIYLNGRKIAEEIIDLNNKRTFATNGAW